MTNKYFDKFPLTTYDGATCVNLMERVALSQASSLNPYLYYPFDIEGYERADQFANRYYGDPFESWIIYLSNNIFDPLREWYLTMFDLNSLIGDKYGTVQSAFQKTKFYRNNWENSVSIFPNNYDALPVILQPYWEPVTTGFKITSYRRKQVDWTLNTNRIVLYNLANTSGFIRDEIVNIAFDVNNLGQGQVLTVDTINNQLYVQHVSGVYLETTPFLKTETDDFVETEDSDFIIVDGGSYIHGTESNANVQFRTFSNGVFIPTTIVAENLTPEEEVYWTPVSYYDYENEKNEFNKTIRVLDQRYAPVAVKNLTDLLSE